MLEYKIRRWMKKSNLDKETFIQALQQYRQNMDVDPLGEGGYRYDGVFTDVGFLVPLHSSEVKRNIFTVVLSFIFGIFTGHGFETFSSPTLVEGAAVLTKRGLYFFRLRKRHTNSGTEVTVQTHSHLPLKGMGKVVQSGRSLLIVHGFYEGTTARNLGHPYRLLVARQRPYSNDFARLKERLRSGGVKRQVDRLAVFTWIVALSLGIALGNSMLARLTNRYRAMDYTQFRLDINRPAAVLSTRYQDRTTSFVARVISEEIHVLLSVEQQQRQVVAVELLNARGRDHFFLLETTGISGTDSLQPGDIIEATAIGRGVLTLRHSSESGAIGHFFALLGDPRLTYIAATDGEGFLTSGHRTYFLHMEAADIGLKQTQAAGDLDTYVSATGNFQLQFLLADERLSPIGNTPLVVVYFDYESIANHRIPTHFMEHNFVIYQNGQRLLYYGGGQRFSEGRILLFSADVNDEGEVEAGQTVHAALSVRAIDGSSITINRYSENMDILFSYELSLSGSPSGGLVEK
ncbi:MAG: hypothetical protein FWF59_07575 [Turicibacter sp.]|nr:hypothetical protein [Turicibacter sp.]